MMSDADMDSHMPVNLALGKIEYARTPGGPSDRFPGNVPAMPKPKTAKPNPNAGDRRSRPKKPPSPLQLEIATRLRAVQAEMRCSDQAMADLLHVGRTTWTNWTNAENMPEEQAMIRLCEKAYVTMEWLYRGKPEGLTLANAIRLTARVSGQEPDTATIDVLRNSRS